MKIFTSEQIKIADSFTIEHEPISSINLMERAGEQLLSEILKIFPQTQHYTIFAGPGNNGGDGLVLARLLLEKKKKVTIYILIIGAFSNELLANIELLEAKNITYVTNVEDINNIQPPENSLIIDALFGIGLNRPLEGIAKELVCKINSFSHFKLSIDLPSGLLSNGTEKSNATNTIIANLTLTIQFPKLAFFFAESEPFVGAWKMIDINLSKEFINKEPTVFYAIDELMIKDIIHPRARFGHKGSFGHVLIIAGSKGKIGASILSGKAALRTGCGLLSIQVPSVAASPIHSNFPEAMIINDIEPDYISTPITDTTHYNAIGFGPGVGINPQTSHVLKLLIQNASQPLVIDADGINILSENKTWLSFVNNSTILTPHPGEFDRLTQKHNTCFERLNTQLAFSKKQGVYIVLKGHNTSITTPTGLVFFNTTGNNGMATAGSGDVLTGIITSLCAQGYSALHACLLGVFLHGYAGDKAAGKLSTTSLIASDIISQIPDFFLHFEK